MDETRRCPKCHCFMSEKNFGNAVRLFRCTHCFGIWCEKAYLDAMAELPMIDILDVGDAKLGAVYNRVTDIACPGCGDIMLSSPAYTQPHITVDICQSCASVFLDAGELHDIKHTTVGDWIKAMRIKLHLA